MRIQLLALCLLPLLSCAQHDPEFPRGHVTYLLFSQGVTTGFDHSPDLYQVSLGLQPQFTVSPGVLRIGIKVEGLYTAKTMSLLAGPMLALKMKNISLKGAGSLMNLQFTTAYLFGTADHQAIEGGFAAEVFQMFMANVNIARDHKQDKWWLRAGVGIRLMKKKKKTPEDPMGGH